MTLALKDKRIVISTVGVPHPDRGASIVLFFHYIKAIIDQGAKVLHLISVTSEEATKGQIETYKKALGEGARITILVIEAPLPIIPDRFEIKQGFDAFDAFKTTVNLFKPNAGLAFDLPAAGILNCFELPYKTVWLGDLAFQSNWHNFLYGFRESLKTIRWLPFAVVQIYQWRRLYKKILYSYDDVVVSSKSSEKALASLGVVASFFPYPWPHRENIANPCSLDLPNKPTFLFFGNLAGLGSRSSLHFLFYKLYPLLKNQWGPHGFEILIGGREVLQNWTERAMQECPEIKLVGFIENLAQCMAGCHAVIAPLDVPVGNRSRILTAWSMKALVIAHQNASLGNPSLIDGKTAYLANDASAFADKMYYCVENPDKSKVVIAKAYNTYLKEYSLESASPLFVNLIQKSVS